MYKKVLPFFILIAVAGSISYLNLPNTEERGLNVRSFMTVGVLLAIAQVVAVWFFLSGLYTFRAGLKIAYSLLSLGILLLGFAQLQLSFLSIFHLLNTWWVSSGLVVLPYGISIVAIYGSMYIFAHLLKIRFYATSLTLVTIAALLLATLISFLPHVRPTHSPSAELFFDIYIGLVIWSMVFAFATLQIARRIKHVLAPLYAPAMRWLMAALIVLIFAGFNEGIYTWFLPEITWYTKYAFSTWPLLIGSFIFMCAGAAFKEISQKRLGTNANYLDVVTYAAQLVSNIEQIDAILDQVREITARLSPGQELSTKDKTALLKVYLKIEDYLINQEQIRKFARDDLRARLPEYFERALLAYQQPAENTQNGNPKLPAVGAGES